jgi:hypothetical protein
MPDLNPHPLVTLLAKSIYQEGVVPALSAMEVSAASSSATPHQLADALAESSNVPELVAFAGFLGGRVTHEKTVWQLLYLDSRLRSWLMFEKDEIIGRDRVNDKSAPSGQHDVIWVAADAAVGRGGGSQPVEARFLTGQFTRAGDFDASPAGGAGASTGVFCPTTPVCCYRTTRR